MTARKHFKQLVRDRMAKTGECYSTARRQILQKANDPTKTRNSIPWHFPGNVPATTALRSILTRAGIYDPDTRQPFSEAMLFGLAGGVGIGIFSFFYEKENVATFFIAGRHLWHDDIAYMDRFCERLGLKPEVSETSSPKAADKNLRTMLEKFGTCVAWVDMTHLPHRAMPAQWSGGGYHVITVYQIDDAKETALIGDLTDEPISISLKDLATARSRIKKFKNRLLALPAASTSLDWNRLLREGLRACHQGLTGALGVPNAKTNFSLAAIELWGKRMHNSKDKESWERVFAPGARLWQGLTPVANFIDYYGTGGGLCRPLFAEYLKETGQILNDPTLTSLAQRYQELGQQWTELAEAALPKDVTMFAEARQLQARRAELTHSGGSAEEISAVWNQLDNLAKQASANFSLTASECADLRAQLQQRIFQLYEGEMAAHQELGNMLA